MIQYALRCEHGHRFESWFQSAQAYDKLAAAGMVSCAVCGHDKVEKAIMAPSVRPARSASAPQAPEAQPQRPLSAPASAAEQAMAEMRRRIEANSDYVGMNFASEARAMHVGDAPERAIHGEARADEARKLIEDGIPVTPLPFLSNRKAN